ncbi:MAG: PilZ domain-containing protein [Acidobacteriota bacterium]
MADLKNSYRMYGKAAAKQSLCFPGLGQLYNKHYAKGMIVIGVFTFATAFLVLACFHSKARNNALGLLILASLPPIIWMISVLEAYCSAVEERRANARRHATQVLIKVRGIDSHARPFEEVAVSKNLSGRGACLIMSTELREGTDVWLEFERKTRSLARVVWTRQTTNRNEHLVGVELQKPLKAR